MGRAREEMNVKNFIIVIGVLTLAGCGGSKELEKKGKVDPEDPMLVVPGYRVQLYATPGIDDANAKKARAEKAFPDQWFYLVYDAPTYKLRGGNFLIRADADSYAKYLTGKGFPDAWTVPEKIFKNPPPRQIPEPQDNKEK